MKPILFASPGRRALFGLAIVALLCSACKQSLPEFVYDDESEDQERASVVVTDENGNAATVPAGTTIGVYVIGADGNVTLQSAEVGADGTVVLPATASNEGLIAYLPYQEHWNEEALASPQPFAVQPDQSTQGGYDAGDLMIGRSGTATRGDSRLTFSHMLAKVLIHIVDETGTVDFAQCSLLLHDMHDAVDVLLAQQSVATIGDSTADVRMLTVKITDNRLSLAAIVAPQTKPAGERFVEFLSAGSSQYHAIPQDVELQGGKTCVLTLRLTEGGLVYDGSSISDWEEGGGDSLDATE